MARPRLHDDALRTRLLEVTSEVISSDGESAVTVRGVAVRAGTSASAVYALFGSRDALVAAVSEEGFRRFGARLAAAAHTDDPLADLRVLGRAYRDGALANPHFYRVMFERAVPPGSDAPPAVDRPTFLVLRDAVARVLALHEAPAAPGAGPGGRASEDVALALWSLVHGLVSLELAGLVPGDDAARSDRYDATLAAAGPALLTALAARPSGG
ncbi:transcriptional regulator, TetR family [Xylanimonas cellulosilytica DSM 15894]|uniref:Transcriptional regulator, TetR family n=1 Tax=Xylanimonas cellulosilytica (strain DSM 15894 / JCM 12276 / CECT 5975 / KCTC 9989 / LMG 20990 / NBRC 107835 / XIL07) TaxID=446471 RepID=D1C073_XYLCX|nr:TetR/AcrR family transcriptional regulator [Xylanimonas cellulosilytica]ACZ30262.1 transcriptional regulator, TetR family [Xylanimonas cellulosilytica DSM 15894]